jgi:hypothetical protein
MITKITTHVVYCDGDTCDESFGDNVATSADVIARLAVTVGKWRVRDGEHHCPRCVEQELDRQVDALHSGPPQDEGDGPERMLGFGIRVHPFVESDSIRHLCDHCGLTRTAARHR